MLASRSWHLQACQGRTLWKQQSARRESFKPHLVRLRSCACLQAPAKKMYETEVEIASKAVRLASRLCQTVQRGLAKEDTHLKEDKSPVTVADYGSQALVSWSLQRSLPPGTRFSLIAEEDSEDLKDEAGLATLEKITKLVNDTLAEEGEVTVKLTSSEVMEAIDQGWSEGGPKGRYWVLDPIDGTRGFVRGDQYAVALGLIEDGKVVVGVLGCPNLPMASIVDGVQKAVATGAPVGCLFAASKGGGTTVQPLDGSAPPTKVHISSITDTTHAAFCESYESAHSQQGLTADIAKELGVAAPPVRIDSQAKYGAMARGDATIYMRFPHKGYREKIWDHAAGAIVVQEAGGVVCDAAGDPLDFSRGRYLDLEEGIISTNPTIMPALLKAVQKCIAVEKSKLVPDIVES